MALTAGGAAPALADAPSVVPGSTQGSVVVDGDGSRTVTVQGQWSWPSQTTDCNTTRAGAGYAVDWADPNQAGNSLTTLNSVALTVGVATGNTLNGADNLVHATAPATDSTSISVWRSGCGTFTNPPGYNTGSWGPISHTYSAAYTGAITICPIFYDVHGTASGGPSSASLIVAGGAGHNSDDSAQDNGSTAAGNECPTTTLMAQPSLSVTPPATGDVGSPITAQANLSGGLDSGGTITFTAYGPNDPTCLGTPAFTGTASVSGAGNYNAPSFTPTQAGTYEWVASYGGDAADSSAANSCGDASSSVLATPSMSWSTPATSARVGQAVHDTAALAGGQSPGGTVGFALYGPGDATCSQAPAFTSSAVTVNGDGDYASPDFTPPHAGTYRWVATYSGDADNAATTTACGAPGSLLTIAKAAPAVTATTPGDVTLGQPLSAAATLSGGVAPGGSISFALYGPTDAGCAAVPLFTAVAAVSGNGSYHSPSYTPTQAGTYRWVASYGGDQDNASTASSCGDAHDASTVSAVPAPAPSLTVPFDPTPAALKSIGVTTAPPAPTPDLIPASLTPAIGRSVAMAPLSGTVLVHLPGTHQLTPLSSAASLPVGALVDTTRGTVLVAAARDRSGTRQLASAGGGVFQVTQTRHSPLTTLVLHGGNFAQLCAAASPRSHMAAAASSSASRRRRVVRWLWSTDNHGHFSTQGHNSIATVRGTSWITVDRCDGTMTVVIRGQVMVHDTHQHRFVLVDAGHSYLARN